MVDTIKIYITICIFVAMVVYYAWTKILYIKKQTNQIDLEMQVNRERIKLERTKFNVNTIIDNNYISLLDVFIGLELQDYIKLHPQYIESIFISNKEEEKLAKELIQRVKNNISDSILEKLTMIYKKESLNTIIAEKCYVAIANLKVQKTMQSMEQ